jgi:ubiquitin-protein ligase
MEKNEYALDYVLQAEYNLLRKQFIPGIIVIPSGKSNLIWNGVHFISQGPYEGGVFRFLIFIPDTFPDGDCPKVQFTSTIYHPQIDINTGELDIVRYFPVWKRNGHHLWQVLRYIRRIFQKIETTNALNLDAAHLYEQDPSAFLLKVSQCVNQSKDQLYNSDLSTADDPHAIIFTPWNERLQTVRQHLLAGKKIDANQKEDHTS